VRTVVFRATLVLEQLSGERELITSGANLVLTTAYLMTLHFKRGREKEKKKKWE